MKPVELGRLGQRNAALADAPVTDRVKPEIAPPHAVDEGPVVNLAIVTKERKPVCHACREQICAKVIQPP